MVLRQGYSVLTKKKWYSGNILIGINQWAWRGNIVYKRWKECWIWSDSKSNLYIIDERTNSIFMEMRNNVAVSSFDAKIYKLFFNSLFLHYTKNHYRFWSKKKKTKNHYRYIHYICMVGFVNDLDKIYI